jgi:ribosomal protein S18 acetylase RimI-like enzyme
LVIGGEEVRLRRATEADGEFLYALYADSRAEEVAATGWDQQRQRAFVRMQFAARHRDYAGRFAAARDSIVLCGGQAVGRLLVDRQGGAVTVVDLALLPSWRGRGIGSALLRQVLDEAGGEGLAVHLAVAADNLRALRLYRRLGFAVAGSTGAYVRLVHPAPGRSPGAGGEARVGG